MKLTGDGILVDEPGHQDDLCLQIQDCIKKIWEVNHNEIEQEMCEIFGSHDLRTPLCKSGGFFNYHFDSYSKSRRYAPIYWPLSTPSGSYTLWLYYHRITDQTLYTCINNYIDPKLQRLNQSITQLWNKSDRTSSEHHEFEEFQELAQELTEFRNELLRIAQLPWKPNFEDGVQITAAPLWKQFRLKKWQELPNK